jgi:hypothetical protein
MEKIMSDVGLGEQQLVAVMGSMRTIRKLGNPVSEKSNPRIIHDHDIAFGVRLRRVRRANKMKLG